jgi:hypothetical protein
VPVLNDYYVETGTCLPQTEKKHGISVWLLSSASFLPRQIQFGFLSTRAILRLLVALNTAFHSLIGSPKTSLTVMVPQSDSDVDNCGAEHYSRVHYLWSHLIVSKHFMEPEGSLPHS